MITTIRLKDLVKHLVTFIFLVLICLSATRFLGELRKNKDKLLLEKQKKDFFKAEDMIALNMPIAKYMNNEEVKEETRETVTSRSGISRMLSIELPNIENGESDTDSKVAVSDNTQEDNNQNQEDQRAENIKESYTNHYGSVKIKNSTSIKLTDTILTPDYNLKNKKNIIIYHTHTCESYTLTDKNTYKASGNYRTTDLKYSVVKVGDVLKEELEKNKFKVIHNNTKHDYPAYNGSYERSLKTIEGILGKNSDTEIIIDLHRDAIGSNDKFAPTVEINGEKVAQVMFVIGTNDGGGKHPNWKNNLKFAVKIQEKANEMYPGLFRPINLRSATFNQKVSNAACILEVGATGNTLEESTASMKYFANVLKEALK